jgi:carboxypeptidase Taq
VSLKDLPEAFDAKMRDYLGLQPPDVSHGVLQDVHWSDMTFGYFPTYALGNVVSVQLWERAQADLGDLDEQFERGEFGPLRDWLREHVHRHGRAFSPQELLSRAEARRALRRRRRLRATGRAHGGCRPQPESPRD